MADDDAQPAGPWTKYQKRPPDQPAAGPWTKYSPPDPTTQRPTLPGGRRDSASGVQEFGQDLSAFWHGLLRGGRDIVEGGARIGARMGEAPQIGATEPEISPERTAQIDEATRQSEAAYQADPTRQAHPFASGLGRFGGNIAASAALTPPLPVPGGPLLSTMGRGALLGAQGGALQGAREAPADRFFPEVGKQAAIGAGLGAGVGVIPGAARAGMERFRTGLPAAQGRLADLEAANVTPNIPMVSGQPLVQQLTRAVGTGLPGSAIEPGINRTAQETSQAVLDASQRYGTIAGTNETGGKIAQNATKEYANDRAEAEKEFGQFFALMHGGSPIRLTNTVAKLRQLMGQYPSAPELEGMFSNGKLPNLLRAVQPKAQAAPRMMGAEADPVTGIAKPVYRIGAPTARSLGGLLSTPEIKQLRTSIGYMLDNPTAGPEHLNKAEVRSLYGALTNDLRRGAQERSPDAVRALSRAVNNYSLRRSSTETLDPLIRSESPGHALALLEDAARSGRTTNTNLLITARGSMSPADWNETVAQMVRGLATPLKSERRTGEQPFSIVQFADKYRQLDPRAKDILFGEHAPGNPRDGLDRLDRIARMVTKFEPLSSATRSWAARAPMAVIVMQVAGQILNGGGIPGAEIAGAGAAYAGAKALMSPAFTRMIYAAPKIVAASRDNDSAIQNLTQAFGLAMRGGLKGGTMQAIGGEAAPNPRVAQLRRQAYDANRAGNFGQVQSLDRQRQRLEP